MPNLIIPILGADIKDLATLMIQRHGGWSDEADRRARGCHDRCDKTGCDAWWRVAAAVRDVLGATPGEPLY